MRKVLENQFIGPKLKHSITFHIVGAQLETELSNWFRPKTPTMTKITKDKSVIQEFFYTIHIRFN
jgi:hypothetical protein